MNVIKSSNGSNHMNVRHLVPSVSRRLLSMGSLILAASLHYASGEDLSKYKRIEPQFIAALGDPGATSGNGAQSWGLLEPGSGPARLQAGPLPSIEGDRRGAGAVEIRRFGLVVGRTRLDHGEADLSAACWEISRHG